MPTAGTIGEVKDIVREHFSRTQFPTGQLDQALAEGRRIIENGGNFWWMRDRKDFSLVIGQGSYSILTSTNGGLNLPNFKDAIAFTWTTVGGTVFEPISVGDLPREEAEVIYSDDIGTPELVVIENDTLYVFPEKPLAAYSCRFYYWQWTTNPLLNTATDVITQRFPMSLCYAAIAWGYEMVLHDLQSATYYRQLLADDFKKIKRENFKRGWGDMMLFMPRMGPNTRFRKRLDNVQIYR